MTKKFNAIGFKKLANVLRIITHIFYWASIIGILFSIIVSMLLLFVPHGDLTLKQFTNAQGNVQLETGRGLAINMPQATLKNDADLTWVFISILIALFIVCIALAVIFRQIRDILKTVATDTPFEEKNAHRLLTIGTVLIVFSLSFNIIVAKIYIHFIKTFGMSDINISAGVDMFMLLTGLFTLILAGIFKYGAYLQNEYDATL